MHMLRVLTQPRTRQSWLIPCNMSTCLWRHCIACNTSISPWRHCTPWNMSTCPWRQCTMEKHAYMSLTSLCPLPVPTRMNEESGTSLNLSSYPTAAQCAESGNLCNKHRYANWAFCSIKASLSPAAWRLSIKEVISRAKRSTLGTGKILVHLQPLCMCVCNYASTVLHCACARARVCVYACLRNCEHAPICVCMRARETALPL